MLIIVLKANPKQFGFLVINVWLDAIDFFLGTNNIRVQRK
jgi:hypothetical protein